MALFGRKRTPAPRAPAPARPVPGRFRPEDLENRIKRLFEAEGYNPPMLPTSASQILLMAQRPDVSIEDIHGALETDPMMVAAVLKLVRSPMYGRGDVRSLKDALVRLGVVRIRNLVMEVAMKGRVFKAPGYAEIMESLQRHGRAVAHLSRLVARKVDRDPDVAFLCGLLHDVGLMAILAAVDEDIDLGTPRAATLVPAARRFHAGCSAQVALAWDLPPLVLEVLAIHHQLRTKGVGIHPVAATVSVAEALSYQLGHGVGLGMDPIAKDEVEVAIRALELSGPDLDQLAQDGQQLLAQMA